MTERYYKMECYVLFYSDFEMEVLNIEDENGRDFVMKRRFNGGFGHI